MINQTESFLLNLCIARHLARIYGASESAAIKRCARKVRDETKLPKLYELAKHYINHSCDKWRVESVAGVEADLRKLKAL